MKARFTSTVSAEITDRSARGIAAAVGRLISSGELPVGTRLPTVRDLSKELGVSPTTVSEAWQSLAAVGAIDARGRQGTFVRQPTGPATPRRYRRVTEGPGRFALDLSTGTPDPALLPDLRPVIARVSRQSLTSSYLDQPVLPELAARVRADWPFHAEELTVVDGAMDALDRVAGVVVRLGDRVAVEHPTFPPLLDLLDLLGAEVIGIDLDEQGMVPSGLAAALAAGATAVFLQPRAHNPTGITLTAQRGHELAALLANSDALVVEDDHSGDIASGALVSLGKWLPQRTVHIRSYSKSHGPDLRLAAVGVEYAARRSAVTAVLAAAVVGFTGTDGINLWMQVADERSAMLTLAAQGIGAAPGEPFMVRDDAPSLRVTVGNIHHSVMEYAARLADAAGNQPARSGQR